ncbi:MAG: HD domain-containing protein [Desulfuromonadales bacterium]
MFNLLVKPTSEQKLFLAKVRAAMEHYFGDDQKRIDHALQVCRYAEELLTYIDADPVLTLTSAYLHDIGIHEAERKHGSNAGNWQELEGPPVAVAILAEVGAEIAFINQVTEIIGNHHTPGGVDSPEFRIIWDADALVNFAEILPSKSMEQIDSILRKHMVTEPGFQIAHRLFSGDSSNNV